MKKDRRLSGRRMAVMLLALSLALIVLPLSANAASQNGVTEVAVIALDNVIPVGDSYLAIEDHRGDLAEGNHTIRLQLENAAWAPAADWHVNQFRFYRNGSPVANGSEASVSLNRVTDTRLEVTFTLETTAVGVATDEIRIPLRALVHSVGDATVTIDPLNSYVSAGSFVFATGVLETALVNVGEMVTFGPNEIVELDIMTLEETEINGIMLEDALRFRLPATFTWDPGMEVVLKGTGGFSHTGTLSGDDILIQGQDLQLTPADAGLRRSLVNQRGKIELSGLAITSRGDRFGDVNITTGGALAAANYLVARYQDYGVDIYRDGLPAKVLAGRLEGVAEGTALTTLIVEETVAGSLAVGRFVDITFDPHVKVTRVFGVEPAGFNPGDSAVTFVPQRDQADQKLSYEILLEVTVHPHMTGDIVATVSGGGMAETTSVVLGEVTAPVDIEAEEVVWSDESETWFSPGIRLEESARGALMEGVLRVELGLGEWLEIPEITVVEGDLILGEISIEEEWLLITIAGDSGEASTLVIEPAEVTIPGLPAFGIYTLSFGGEALVNNNLEPYFEENLYLELDILNYTQGPVVVFYVGKPFYLVNNEQVAMDAAPFLSDGRLMVPVSHVSRALGIPREAVVWDGDNRTVTIRTADTKMRMTIGSTMMEVNDSEIDMGAAAVIRNDRTFVPVSRFARALNVAYTWDAEAQTVTFH